MASKGADMSPNEKTEWLLRFAARLHQVHPGMAGSVAAEIATLTYADARDLSPEEAAEIYALEEPPGDAGAPGD